MRKFCLCVVYILVCTLITAPAWAAVGMRAGTPAFTVNTDSSTIVGFGGKQWVVIGHNGSGVASINGTLTLLANEGYGDSQFHAMSNAYSGSALRTAMSSAYGGLPTQEKGLVAPRELVGGSGNQATSTYNDNNIAGATVLTAYFWPLSVNEANLVNNTLRQFPMNWWLRSPGFNNDIAAYVFINGTVDSSGFDTSFVIAVRPAFNFDLTPVILTSATSAASGKNSVTAGSALSATGTLSGPVKFTVEDSANVSLICTDTAARIVAEGDTVSIAYSGAKTAANKYVSCVVVNSSGTVLFYGKLASAASGTAEFIVPAKTDLPSGSYTIKLFNEQCNADNVTDYASSPINIPLTVKSSGGGGGGGCDAFGGFGILALAVLLITRKGR